MMWLPFARKTEFDSYTVIASRLAPTFVLGVHRILYSPSVPVGASLLAIALSSEHDPVAANLTDTNAHQRHGTVADLKQRVAAHL